MKKLNLRLENCYGIKKLDADFEFKEGKRTYVIYAANGVMKTSFAKTFKDLTNNEAPQDLVYKHRKTISSIKDENNADLLPDEVFVIEPYREEFCSKQLSTLMVKKELKEKYDEIYRGLDEAKREFIKKLKGTSDSTDCEREFIDTFKKDGKNDFFDSLIEMTSKLDTEGKINVEFKYNDVFDKKGAIKNFLDSHKEELDEYIRTYDSLISKSEFFRKSDKSSFGTYQAQEISKSIQDGSYFEAGHLLTLRTKKQITTYDEYKNLIKNEKEKVLSDENLKKAFDKIEKKLGANDELRRFKKVLNDNNALLVELKDYERFRKRVWESYFDKLKTDVDILVNLYNEKKNELEEIIKEANETKTDWETAVKDFNNRFKGMPFSLEIENKDDVILKTSTPSIKFSFDDSGEKTNIEGKDLLNVLSQGERRALYILNIIFEVEARKKSSQKTLFIVDDIADSFDYKNKYAIMEYLYDISKKDNFYQIILTHNFDFFRSITNRFDLRANTKMAIKKENGIFLKETQYLYPFTYFKSQLHKNDRILIASITFFRNLVEYLGDKENETRLTSLLHIKSGTRKFTIYELKDIINRIRKNNEKKFVLNDTDNDKKVLDLIYGVADQILKEKSETSINLENKIVLSIATRLKAEEFMIYKINDEKFVEDIKKHQTLELIQKYKECYPNKDEIENIEILDQVNLMTPENIHINSFMYEPILDMSDEYLRELYNKITNLHHSIPHSNDVEQVLIVTP